MSIGSANKYQTHSTATLSGTLTLTKSSASHQALDPGGSARNVDLPDMGAFGSGTFHIDNTADGSEVITLRDAANSNATVGTPTQNESATCYWSSDGAVATATGGTDAETTVAKWICVVGAAN